MVTNNDIAIAMENLPPRPPLNTGAAIGVSSLAYTVHNDRGDDPEFDALFNAVSDISKAWDADLHQMRRHVYTSDERVWMIVRPFPMDRLNRLVPDREISSEAQNGLRLFRTYCPELGKLKDAAVIDFYRSFTKHWPPSRNSHFLFSLIGKLAKKDAAFSGEARSIGEHIAYWLLRGERPEDAFRQGLEGHNYNDALATLAEMVSDRAASITEESQGPR